MILVNPNLDFKVEKCVSDKNGRFLILNLIIDESHLIPDLENRLVEFSQENIIVAGDFNCALSDKDKNEGGNPVSKKAIVIKEIHLYNLTDIWRLKNDRL